MTDTYRHRRTQGHSIHYTALALRRAVKSIFLLVLGHCVLLLCSVVVSVLSVADTDCRLIEIGNVAQATGGHVRRNSHPVFTARRYAVVVCLSLRPSVCQKLVLYHNDWTNRAGFWREGFFPPVTHCVIWKFGYLQKFVHFPLALSLKLRA